MDDQGIENAAILLMSLGEEQASEVFKHLAPKEVQRMGETIAKLRTVSRERLDSVLEKFNQEAGGQSMLVDDNDEYVRSVLKRALGEDKANLLLDRILQGDDVSGIESLKWMEPSAVAELMRHEHPQIVAAILVHLESEHAAAVLKLFTERQRNEVLVRVATLDGIQPSAMRATWVGAAMAFTMTSAVGLWAAAFPHTWLKLFSSDPQMLEAGTLYLRSVGPFYGFYGLGLVLYFASQGAGKLKWPVIGNIVRLAVAGLGGWLALRWSGSLAGVFITQAVALLLYGLTNASAIAAGAWFGPLRWPRRRLAASLPD